MNPQNLHNIFTGCLIFHTPLAARNFALFQTLIVTFCAKEAKYVDECLEPGTNKVIIFIILTRYDLDWFS